MAAPANRNNNNAVPNLHMSNSSSHSGNMTPFFRGAPISKAFTTFSILIYILCEMFELHSVMEMGKILKFSSLIQFI